MMRRAWWRACGWGVVGLCAGVVTAAAQSTAADAESRTPPKREFRVCADPNNLPYSNEQQEGFENKIAELIARDLNATVRYTWYPQRRGFIRNTLRANECDVVMGVPSSFELVLATKPYYRSGYAFLTRKDRNIQIGSLDDPVLREIRVGVHTIGDDDNNSPPAHALAKRGIISNVVGYSVYGDYSKPNPPADLVDAVANGEIDAAIVWGPIAGYFAQKQAVPMAMTPVTPQVDLPFLPFVYDISMGVRRDDPALQQELEGVLDRRQAEIGSILQKYGVPIVGRGARRAASPKGKGPEK